MSVLRLLIPAAVLAAVVVESPTPCFADSQIPVDLPAIVVETDFLTIKFSCDSDGKVLRGWISEVLPHSPADKRDMEMSDELIEIDGTPIEGRDYDAVRDLLYRPLKRGEERKMLFRGNRGLLRLHVIRYVYTVRQG